MGSQWALHIPLHSYNISQCAVFPKAKQQCQHCQNAQPDHKGKCPAVIGKHYITYLIGIGFLRILAQRAKAHQHWGKEGLHIRSKQNGQKNRHCDQSHTNRITAAAAKARKSAKCPQANGIPDAIEVSVDLPGKARLGALCKFHKHHIGRMARANRKYTKSDRASTIEVIKGLAITAGSRRISFATIGSTAPTIFAASTVKNRARHTTKFT